MCLSGPFGLSQISKVKEVDFIAGIALRVLICQAGPFHKEHQHHAATCT